MGKLPTRVYPPIFLEEWMKVLGKRPVDLAQPHTSVKASYISNLSTGGRRLNPSALVMLEISRVLGITVNDLYVKPPSIGVVDALAAFSPAARTKLLEEAERRK